MKLVTFEVPTVLGPVSRLGAMVGEFIIDLNTAYRWMLSQQGEAQPKRLADVIVPSQMRAFIEMGQRSLVAAQEVLHTLTDVFKGQDFPHEWEGATLIFKRSEVRLQTPLPDAGMLRDFLAFETHTKSGFERRGQPMPEAWYKLPVYYKGNPRTIIGDEEPIIWPSYTKKLDYELELACIIGKEGKNIPVEKAHEYIFGYAILNDFSARDIQMEEMTCRLGPAKGKDFASAIGPYILTADEIGDPRNLKMLAKINGEVWSEGNSGSSHWTFEQMIAHVSMEETLYPGDILGSGTVGRGCGLELDRWLQPGDVVELQIEKLGTLRNQVLTHEMLENPEPPPEAPVPPKQRPTNVIDLPVNS